VKYSKLVAQLHDEGYQFIGPTAFTKLTLPEVRILHEGKQQIADEKKRQRRAENGSVSAESGEVSDTRMDIERSRDMNDKKMVQDIADT